MTQPWTPTPAEVKAVIPQRASGEAFSATTIPTADQVTTIATNVAEEVLADVGGNIPVELHGQAKHVASLGAAAHVEQGFYPEQQLGDQGPGEILYRRYTEALTRLRAAVDRLVEPDVGDAFTVATPSATVADYLKSLGP